MNPRRTLAISRRIVNQFRRDHRTLALLFVAPIIVLGLLGWVIRDQSTPSTHLAIVTVAEPLGDRVRDTLERAADDAGIDVRRGVTDEATARRLLADGEIDVALVLPSSIVADLAGGRSPTLRILTPGVAPTDDQARIAGLSRILVSLAGGRTPTITHETVYGSPDADVLDAFAPALLGFFAYFLVFVLTGISFLRERVGGTLERLLATPVRRLEIVAGYGLGFGFFATLQVIVILTFGLGSVAVPAIGPLPAFEIGLGIANAGSPILVFFVVLLLALGAVNLGIFLSTFARTEFQILQFIPLVVVPQALLGGVFWSLGALPDALQPVARVLPLTYAVDGLREILVKGSGLGSSALQLDIAVLAGVAIFLVVVAGATIRREVA